MRLELDIPDALGLPVPVQVLIPLVDWALGEGALASVSGVSELRSDKSLLNEVNLANDEVGDPVLDMLESVQLDLPWDWWELLVLLGVS